jgi:hypothetical protein
MAKLKTTVTAMNNLGFKVKDSSGGLWLLRNEKWRNGYPASLMAYDNMHITVSPSNVMGGGPEDIEFGSFHVTFGFNDPKFHKNNQHVRYARTLKWFYTEKSSKVSDEEKLYADVVANNFVINDLKETFS